MSSKTSSLSISPRRRQAWRSMTALQRRKAVARDVLLRLDAGQIRATNGLYVKVKAGAPPRSGRPSSRSPSSTLTTAAGTTA